MVGAGGPYNDSGRASSALPGWSPPLRHGRSFVWRKPKARGIRVLRPRKTATLTSKMVPRPVSTTTTTRAAAVSVPPARVHRRSTWPPTSYWSATGRASTGPCSGCCTSSTRPCWTRTALVTDSHSSRPPTAGSNGTFSMRTGETVPRTLGPPWFWPWPVATCGQFGSRRNCRRHQPNSDVYYGDDENDYQPPPIRPWPWPAAVDSSGGHVMYRGTVGRSCRDWPSPRQSRRQRGRTNRIKLQIECGTITVPSYAQDSSSTVSIYFVFLL